MPLKPELGGFGECWRGEVRVGDADEGDSGQAQSVWSELATWLLQDGQLNVQRSVRPAARQVARTQG